VVDNGVVLDAIEAIVPSDRMNNMSKDRNVSFIQNDNDAELWKAKSMPAFGDNERRNIKPRCWEAGSEATSTLNFFGPLVVSTVNCVVGRPIASPAPTVIVRSSTTLAVAARMGSFPSWN